MSTSPRRLGKYELQEQLGRGGMAEVWKALDTQLQRYVAIKLLHANLQEDPQFVARFEREAQLIASLHHPNIVQIHDFQTASSTEEGTIAYMVMDYVEGQTLADYIRSTSGQRNFPSPAEIERLFTPICRAVDYAHRQGVIHRDLKPANILLDKRNTAHNEMGEPVLTDFGLAKLLGLSASTLTAAQPGTPYYIAPELVRGYAGNERSDIYSLGVILYEMVTGILPFQGDTPTAVLQQHLQATPPFPALINPNAPPALATVIMRCLAKDPTLRFSSAEALAGAIAEALNVPGQSTPMTPVRSGSGTTLPTYPASQNTPLPPSQQYPTPTPAGSTWQATPTSLGAISRVATTSAGGVFTPAPSQPNIGLPAMQAPTAPPPRKTPRALIFGLIALIVIILLGGLAGAYFQFLRPVSTPPLAAGTVVGHAFYVSSGQLVSDGKSAADARGIADELQVDLQNVQPPPSGKSYYLWLLADKDTTPKPDLLVPPPIHPPLLLTNNLPVQPDGTVHYIYPGDAQHDNLLSVTSRLLITLEDAGRTPASPSTDHSAWIYYAQLPQAYIPHDPTGLRGLDHIRHLYYNEDHLQVLALYGGLDIWVFRNTEKLLEWSTSARDDFDGTTAHYGQMHALFTAILDYLDGTSNVHVDVPPGTPVTANPNIGRISLLTVDPTRQGVAQYLATDPPGDLDHLILHITELNRAPDATPEIHTLSQEISFAITNAKGWLTQARADAKQLFDMTPAQLAQNTTVPLLDDLVTQVTYAYIGQLDPNTDTVKPGVLEAHYAVQQLATFDISRSVPQSL